MKNLAILSQHIALCCVMSLIAAVQVVGATPPRQKQDVSAHASARTAFTYQGQLRDASGLINGTFDIRSSLYTTQAGGQALGSVEHEGLALTHGLFSLQLDFGLAARETSEAWLEIAVRAHGSPESYAVLSPRQKLTSTPYAILAQAEPWSLIGVPVGFNGKVIDTVTDDGRSNPSLANQDATTEQSIKSVDALKDGSASAEPRVAVSPQATQNFIAKFDNRGQPFTDSIMFDNGTNVGISTTSPGSKLDVAGTAQFRGAAGGIGLVVNSSGNVGIGTAAPQDKLDVRGNVKLGSSGQLFATGGGENLRIVRGVIAASGDIVAGSGFQVSHTTQPFRYTITFVAPFSAAPAVTVTAQNPAVHALIGAVTQSAAVATVCQVAASTDGSCVTREGTFHFIAIGPR